MTSTATAATAALAAASYDYLPDPTYTAEKYGARVVAGTGTGMAMLANRIGIRVQLAIVRQQSMARHPSRG